MQQSLAMVKGKTIVMQRDYTLLTLMHSCTCLITRVIRWTPVRLPKITSYFRLEPLLQRQNDRNVDMILKRVELL